MKTVRSIPAHPTVVYLALLGLTALSFESAHDILRGTRLWIAVPVTLIALLKIIGIGLNYMEIRSGPRWAVLAFCTWASVTIAAILLMLSVA